MLYTILKKNSPAAPGEQKIMKLPRNLDLNYTLQTRSKRLGEAVRGHWGVENPLHWTLDVTFGED